MSVLDWLARRARLGPTGKLSPFIVWSFRTWAGALMRVMFRPTMTGEDRLPTDRPFLLVSNHSGGGASEIVVLLSLWVRRFGDSRPVAGMAHPVTFSAPVVANLLYQVGAVPSTYDAALDALGKGVPVLVFPGGDHDSFRPVWQANKVDFNRRKGFLKIARKAGVPVVPMAIRGSHYTLPILWRSRVLPYLLVLPALLGIKRFPLSLPGVVGGALFATLVQPPLGPILAWLWQLGPFSSLVGVLPFKIRVFFGAPIEPEDLFGKDRDDDAVLDPAYDRVVGEIQKLLAPPSS